MDIWPNGTDRMSHKDGKCTKCGNDNGFKHSWCRPCQTINRKKWPNFSQKYHLKIKYGLSISEYSKNLRRKADYLDFHEKPTIEYDWLFGIRIENEG